MANKTNHIQKTIGVKNATLTKPITNSRNIDFLNNFMAF